MSTGTPSKAKPSDREAKLAAALRANLRRRKAAPAPAAPAPEAPQTGEGDSA
jgi:hypothetical protein